jgi:ribulose-phosphate 3-epimerase
MRKDVHLAIEDPGKYIKLIRKENLNVDIEVDGGVYEDTIDIMANAGANVFVVGRAIFESKLGIEKAILHIRRLAEQGYKD